MGNKTLIVAARDSAIQAFGQPFFVKAAGQAVRSFTDEVNRAEPNNQLYQHPDDFELWQIAIFDEDTGEILQEPGFTQRLVRGKDVQNKAE